MAQRSNSRAQNWDSDRSSGDTQELQTSIEDEMVETHPQPKLRSVQDVHNALHPLRATADRVGKEVEKFAESLDRLASFKLDIEDCRKVLPAVRSYEKIATETVARLRRYHEPERQQKLKGSWKRKVEQARTPTPSIHGRGGTATSGTKLEDLENWENERQTWQLLRLLLQCQYPVADGVQALPDQEAKYLRPALSSEIHPYSTEHELWNSFLGEWADVWEKQVIVEWLKSNAESNGPSIDVVVEELDEAAERGKGLSAHGWLYSKEAIKAQKRLRAWSKPLDAVSSDPNSGIFSKDKTKKLVTQLDPDAFSRQDCSIETEDTFFERAAWLGCWEMLRRGESWQAIRMFCQERVECWRALSIRGDPRLPESNKKGLDIYAGPRSRSLWRKMCEITAKEGGINDYENAVYGLLCGSFEAVEKVARGWDDMLFALYNAQVLQQFEYFVQKTFPGRLPTKADGQIAKLFANPTKPSVLSGKEAWEMLLSHQKTKAEARSPIKMIQGSLIARTFEKYVHQQGLALGRSASGAPDKSRQILMDTSGAAFELGASADISITDYDILRILTHIIFVFMELKVFKEISAATENIIFAYVSFLADAGKYELLPVYAAKLSEKASIELMARQLQLIVNVADQKTIMGLMKQYKLNTTEILRRHLLFLRDKVPLPSDTGDFPKLDLVEQFQKGTFDMPTINRDFMSGDVTDAQADLIRAVEWYMALDGAWEETLWAATAVYKHLLRAGALVAAALLAQTVTFSYISESKTRPILGVAIDLGFEWTSRGNAEEDHKVEVMTRQSSTLRGLENMVWALISLDKWRRCSEKFQQSDTESRVDLQAAHDRLVIDAEQLFNDWLQHPGSEEEKAELESIRINYLPDILFAYISALYFNGHTLSREILLKIMNLAIDVAAHGSELGTCLQAARRITEFTDYMAVGSLAVLRAEETMARKRGGKVKKTRAGPKGENLDIWNMKLPAA